jgi:tripartite-type tricarboxylate transporter receptor subunit TctC
MSRRGFRCAGRNKQEGLEESMCDGASDRIGNRWIGAIFVLAAFVTPFETARSEEFPSENIRLIVNVAAGGVTDSVARLIGHGLMAKWGRPVIVENLVGGNSSIAAQAVVRAKPDGYTLFVTADAPFTSTPFIVRKLSFSLAQFTPIAVVCRPVPVLAVRASLGVKTLKEFIALAKVRPNTLNYASQGIGTYGHLGMEDLKRRTGMDILHVPYRGGAPAIEGLVRGDVAALIINYSNIEPFVQSGDVVLLAALGQQRSKTRPDLPIAIEEGIPYSVSTWFGIFGPAEMPSDLVSKIRNGVEGVLASDKSAEFFKLNSCERVKATPQQFSEIIAADYNHWRNVVETVGIQPE